MKDGYMRGALSPRPTQRQMDVLTAYVAAGGSVHDAAELVGIRPSTVKRHLADLRARSGLTTEQLIYAGRAAGLAGGRESGDRVTIAHSRDPSSDAAARRCSDLR
jgi:predicted ArsR family transcriptional regulator